MPRLFTIEQAERLLPELEPNVRLAISLKPSWQAAQQEFDAETRRIAVSGGSLVNHEKWLALRSRLDANLSLYYVFHPRFSIFASAGRTLTRMDAISTQYIVNAGINVNFNVRDLASRRTPR